MFASLLFQVCVVLGVVADWPCFSVVFGGSAESRVCATGTQTVATAEQPSCSCVMYIRRRVLSSYDVMCKEGCLRLFSSVDSESSLMKPFVRRASQYQWKGEDQDSVP